MNSSNSEGESISGENSSLFTKDSKTPSTKPAPSETFQTIISKLEEKIVEFDNWFLKRYPKFKDDIDIMKHRSVDYNILKSKLETAKQLKELVEKAIDNLKFYTIESDLEDDTKEELRKVLGVNDGR